VAENYLPTRETEITAWSAAFLANITPAPTTLGLSALQVGAYGTLNSNWTAAFALANNNATRTPAAIEAKNVALDDLINGTNGIRQLVNIIQAFPGTTNEQRIELGITVRDEEPTIIPAPDTAPVLVITATQGRRVSCRLKTFGSEEGRGKPENVAGATVLMHIGEEAPIDPLQWIFCLNTTQTQFDVDAAPTIAAGAKVWLTAFWRNRKDEAGPTSVPVSARVGDTIAEAA
jgi:hypothetical protein